MTKKILIADDESHIRRLLERTLMDFEDSGVELLFAENGEEALAKSRILRCDDAENEWL